MVVRFHNSSQYWEDRYRAGKWSGAGSYGRLAKYKAGFLNDFVEKKNIKSIIEFGCGDGNQLLLADYPQYFGLDVSRTAVNVCSDLFANDHTKRFAHIDEYHSEVADLALSLDVLYHLVEDHVFSSYMHRLFDAAKRYVIIYSSNTTGINARNPHVCHREFVEWVNHERTDFYLYYSEFNPLNIRERSGGGGIVGIFTFRLLCVRTFRNF